MDVCVLNVFASLARKAEKEIIQMVVVAMIVCALPAPIRTRLKLEISGLKVILKTAFAINAYAKPASTKPRRRKSILLIACATNAFASLVLEVRKNKGNIRRTALVWNACVNRALLNKKD